MVVRSCHVHTHVVQEVLPIMTRAGDHTHAPVVVEGEEVEQRDWLACVEGVERVRDVTSREDVEHKKLPRTHLVHLLHEGGQ